MVPLKLNKGRKSILGGKKMRKSVLIAILFLFFVSFIPLHAQWARTYGDREDDDVARSVQQTTDGGYIVVGYTSSFGTWADFWILKVNSYGEVEWEKNYGGADDDVAYCVQQTTDNGYIVAGYNGLEGSYDLCILKLSSAGNIEWQKSYKQTEWDFSIPHSIQLTTDGGYIVIGLGWILETNTWILKLDSLGEIEWQRTYENYDDGRLRSIQQTSDGGYIVGGSADFGAGGNDYWILKLDSLGEIEWQRTYGGAGGEGLRSIQQTSDDGYIVGGMTMSGIDRADLWILKLDSLGEIEWQRMYNGADESTRSIQQTADDGYIVLGGIIFGSENLDLWILKLDSLGEIEWQRTYGGANSEDAFSIQQTTDEGYIVSGYTDSFGSGEDDVLLLKLFPDGDIHSSCGFIGTLNATIADTFVIPEDTLGVLQDGNFTTLVPTNSVQNTNAIITLICECPRYTLTISSASGGGTDPVPDTYTHYEGTEIIITATPDEDCIFKEWTGDVPTGHEEDNPLIITMDADKSVTANFVRQYQLTIVAGEGGTTEPVPDDYTHDSGAEITITAIPNENYRFLEWTGDVPEGYETNNPVTITIDSDKIITANFIREYTLTIITGEEGTTNPLPGTHIYDVGAEVSIEAMPDENYRFLEWTGDVLSGHEIDNPITITMDSDKSITANFVRQQYTLTITAGTGGTTEPVPSTYIHDAGIEVSIKAIPNSGYEFTEWTGDASGTTNPITIIMDSDKSITANFKATPTPEEPKEKKGGCFIATAAYGSPLHPHIDILREFRDKYLMTNEPGRIFVNFYYKYSPLIADFISKHKFLKIAVRIHLRPLISLSYLIVH